MTPVSLAPGPVPQSTIKWSTRALPRSLSFVGCKPLKEKEEGWHLLVSESSPAIVGFDCNQIKSVNKIYLAFNYLCRTDLHTDNVLITNGFLNYSLKMWEWKSEIVCWQVRVTAATRRGPAAWPQAQAPSCPGLASPGLLCSTLCTWVVVRISSTHNLHGRIEQGVSPNTAPQTPKLYPRHGYSGLFLTTITLGDTVGL